MMRRLGITGVVVLGGLAGALTGCSMQQSACCAAYPIKSFKAIYECTSTGSATNKQTWQSNGKGKVRITTDKSVGATIVDFDKDTVVTLLPQTKTASEAKLDTPWISHASEEQMQSTDLGTKDVDGHPCHGWQVKANGNDAEYWLGEDTGCYVRVTVRKADHLATTMKLVDYSVGPQDPSGFQVPTDFILQKRAQAAATNGVY